MSISIFFRLSILFIVFTTAWIIHDVPNISNFIQQLSLFTYAAVSLGLLILGLIKFYKMITVKKWKLAAIEGIIIAVISILFFVPF